MSKSNSRIIEKMKKLLAMAEGKAKGREAGGRVQLSRAIHGNSSPKLLGNGG